MSEYANHSKMKFARLPPKIIRKRTFSPGDAVLERTSYLPIIQIVALGSYTLRANAMSHLAELDTMRREFTDMASRYKKRYK